MQRYVVDNCPNYRKLLLSLDQVTESFTFFLRELGYGFIHFGTREAQQKALSPEYNNSIIKVRCIRN